MSKQVAFSLTMIGLIILVVALIVASQTKAEARGQVGNVARFDDKIGLQYAESSPFYPLGL